ncbi:MAG: hypothetical protein V4587_00315 [Acidobacteriota bacterium]
MQTHSQQPTINPTSGLPLCQVRFACHQASFGRLPGFDMYNIVALSAPSEKLCVNSTVTLRGIERAGFQPVEVQ